MYIHCNWTVPYNVKFTRVIWTLHPFFAKDVLDLEGVSVRETDFGSEISCIYAQNSSAQGCLIIIECNDFADTRCSKNLIGEMPCSNLFQLCNPQCSVWTLYAFAVSHGVVAENVSIVKKHNKFISLTTSQQYSGE